MQTTQLVKRGGRRVGVGRKRGSGRYDVPTVPVRVPVSALPDVKHLIETGKTKLPIIAVGKSIKAL
ncbi:hypothetical protein [Bradyrhizobium vignae]|uniref:hypothetical protein n=1 Tax=Bradyrhizobium vignae TaxID=1549949 RepID=UPI00100B0562|nr:hypothetical protein [Bradyrhizobium vignae]RXG93249.1 hypothetical protein EAV90_26755 [Bradyrhizobium vignae]